MPGVGRALTLVDVVATLNQQVGQLQQGQTVSGLGDFAEADELFTLSEAVTGTVTTNPGWGAGTWGTATWG